MVTDKFLTEVETADFLNVRPQTLAVWRCTRRVALPFVKIGRAVRYRQSDLDAYLDAHRVPNAPVAAAR